MNKILKKNILPFMLSSALLASITGCGKKEEITTEATTTEVATTEELNETTEIENNDEEYVKNKKLEMAETSYKKYKKYYENQSISKEQLSIMVDVRNEYYQGYSQDQIDDALASIKHIYLSDNVVTVLDNCNTRKYVDYSPLNPDEIVDVLTVLPNPLISEISLTEEDLAIIILYEQLRDELIEEVTSTGTYSDSIVQKINDALIEQEKKGYISESYAGIVAQWQLCNLCQAVNPMTSIITDSDGIEYKITALAIANSEGIVETDVISEYKSLSADERPEELQLKYNEIRQNLIYVKYEEKMTEIEESIKNNASVSLVSETNEVSEEENAKLTNETYEQYKDFYDSRLVSKEDISIMVDIINGDVTKYNKSAIDQAKELVDEILFPSAMQEAIEDCNNNKTISFSDSNIPKVTSMLISHEYTDNLESYEASRDEIAKELATTGTYSDSIKKKINDSIIKQETTDFYEYTDYLESSVCNEGPEYILMAADLQRCNLGKLVNPETSFIKSDTDKYEYQVAPRTDKNEDGYIEKEIVDKYNELKSAGNDIPDDILEKYAIIKMELIQSKYEQQANEYYKLLLKKAGYADVSKLDLQKQKKAILEQFKFNIELENVLAENRMLKEYQLTF